MPLVVAFHHIGDKTLHQELCEQGLHKELKDQRCIPPNIYIVQLKDWVLEVMVVKAGLTVKANQDQYTLIVTEYKSLLTADF